MIMAL